VASKGECNISSVLSHSASSFGQALRVGAKLTIVRLLSLLLGRRRFVLFSRALWMAARLDPPNDRLSDGELLLLGAILRHLPAVDPLVIVDVGANTGQWSTLLLSELARSPRHTAELHVFEPSPAAFKTLDANLSPAPDAVRLVFNQRAVSNFTGTAELSIVAPLSQVNTLVPLERNASAARLTVACVTLDDYCVEQGLPRIHLAKIDTEGNDFRALEGARRLLEEARIDYLQFEYNHRWIAFRNYLKDVFDLIQPYAYVVGKITPKGVEFYDRWDPELERFLEGNYLLCRTAYQSQLPSIRWWVEV
jgi:FkbM family methyltransferase